MSKPIEITKLFKEVTQNPKFKKYFLIGGIIHFLICITSFTDIAYTLYLTKIETLNLKYEIISSVIGLISLILTFWFLGFWINTIKENCKKETNEQFEIASFAIGKNMLSGFIFNIAIYLPAFLLSLVCMLIGILSFITITLGIIIFYPTATAPGTPLPFICGFIAIAITFIVSILAIILMVVLYPQIVSNYINTGIVATCNLKQIFLQIKNNFLTSFKVSTMTIILGILSMIPFLGFYFELVWAKMFAEYAKLNKNEIAN